MALIGMGSGSVMMLNWLEALELAVKYDFEAFEILAQFPQYDPDLVSHADKLKAKEIIKSTGIALSIHAPFSSLNIATPNAGIREESIRQVKASVDLCADLEGRLVVIHNGDYIFEGAREKAPELAELQWNQNIDALKQIANYADSRGVILCLENIGFEPFIIDDTVDDMLQIREQVGSPALFFCLDLGHAELNNESTSALEKMRPYIRHVHLTDNYGQKDDHLIIGQGNFDYSPYLDFLRNFEGIILLEVIDIGKDPAASIKSREYIKKILHSD